MPQLSFDGNIDIATGKSRHAKTWKNKNVLWSDIVKRVSSTHRTAETYAEYVEESKTRQDEIKDVGGFVGGYLVNGRRKKDSVLHRQLLTLDIDNAKHNVWEDFTMLYDCAACMYSTHKHKPGAYRLRLLIPLNREVFPDEYVAIGRKIAGVLGIENFDHTTFDPCRLMYWPSTSKDGEFLFDYQDGKWLDADAVLDQYVNWRDTSEWPVSERYNKAVHKAKEKQGDPTEKPGIVGAFCRARDIHEVINDFLSDVYEACDDGERYTYLHGSTTCGLITYDNMFAYSHHGTDPASGKLCNAFDLVRLHKFGELDENKKEGTTGTELPSYKAMLDLCMKDAKTRKTIGREKLETAKQDFSEPIDGENCDATKKDTGEENDDWLTGLKMDKRGVVLSTINNVVLILRNDPHLKGCFGFDQFEQREIALRALPWRGVKLNPFLEDADDAALRHYLENVYEIAGLQKTKDALDVVTRENSFHPVRDYLNGLTWDGTPRVDTLLVDYLGADDNDFTRAATRKTLTAAIARIMQPGVKFDYTLMPIGKQGLKKSMLFAKLGGKWFSDSIYTVHGQKAYEQLQGVWIAEIAELSGFKKAESESIKAFLSAQTDRYRVAYGHRVTSYPRQNIFIGPTNDDFALKDRTGNRRFWPVRVGLQDPTKDAGTLTKQEIGQIWAEAFTFYRAGELLYLENGLEEKAIQYQRQHTERDEREDTIKEYLDKLLPEDWDNMTIYQRREFLQGDELQPRGTEQRQRVCVAEIWVECFGKHIGDFTTLHARQLHTIMQNMDGWDRYKSKTDFKNYGTQRAYYRVFLTADK